MPIDLPPNQLGIVQAVLREVIPEREVWAFGSRVKWSAREDSDLDLVVRGSEPLSTFLLAKLQGGFDDSSLRVKVDVVDWNRVSYEFKQRILAGYEVVQSATEGSWELVELRDVCDIFDGPHATPSKTASGPIFLGIGNLERGRLNLAEVEHVSEADFEKWTRRVSPRAGDLVFSYETRLGDAALVPSGQRVCLGRRLGLLRPKPDVVDSRFLLYAYLSPWFQDTLRARTIHGSTVDRLPLKEMGQFPFRLAPLNEQLRIGTTLSSLDDLIDLNQRSNQTLEAIGRALFRSWFVNFEPVRAKKRGEMPWGMDAATAALFPDRVVEKEVGEVPDGWEVVPLDQVADFLNGLALQKYPPTGNADLPVIKIAELRSGITATSDWANASVPQKYVIEDGDVLFSWSGSLEVVIWSGGRGALNQHLFKVTSEKYPKWFYYYWTKEHLADFRLTAANKATTMGHINRGHISAAKVVCPPVEVVHAASLVLEPIVDLLVRKNLEARTLATTRDALLPKLLSGKTRVPGQAA